MTSQTSNALAAIHYAKGFHIDGLLADVCTELQVRGMRLGGLLQICETSGAVSTCRTLVHAVDLRTGQHFDIWDDHENAVGSCRLDEAGLDRAAAAIDTAISERVDLLIINRFGRAESRGRGMCPRFASAVEASIPVLTCVRPPYDQAWSTFHDAEAQQLSCDLEDILGWANDVNLAAIRATAR
ncbi:MAG: DUF2478 domain-containing protein [Pseudomonadota bacterium]